MDILALLNFGALCLSGFATAVVVIELARLSRVKRLLLPAPVVTVTKPATEPPVARRVSQGSYRPARPDHPDVVALLASLRRMAAL